MKYFGGEDACVVKIFTKSDTEVRLVLHCNITDQDVTSSIKKLQYVIREFDAKANKG